MQAQIGSAPTGVLPGQFEHLLAQGSGQRAGPMRGVIVARCQAVRAVGCGLVEHALDGAAMPADVLSNGRNRAATLAEAKDLLTQRNRNGRRHRSSSSVGAPHCIPAEGVTNGLSEFR